MDAFSFRNDYQPPSAPQAKPPSHGETPPELYDFNFNGGPVPILASSKVTLIPFVPAWHAPHYAHHLQGDEELVKWMPYTPNPAHGYEEVLECYEKYIRAMAVRSSSSLAHLCVLLTDLSRFARVPSSLQFSILQAKLVRSRPFQVNYLCQTGTLLWSLLLE